MHIVVGVLAIEFDVDYGILGLDGIYAVVDCDGAGIYRSNIGYAAGLGIFNVSAHSFCTQRLTLLREHCVYTTHPEIVVGVECAIHAQSGQHGVAEHIARHTRSSVGRWGQSALHPLIHINLTAREYLTPTTTGIDDVILIGIQESHGADIPPHFAHVIGAPGIAAIVDGASVVLGRVNSAYIVEVLLSRTKDFAL